ncbi:hypothetical protein ACN28G_15115 [Micromonospora sp. WMMA1923]|uniref:hypothetical protein n=1 Tax=Micromonospora sp. WMMA1923 TaxID=3404125 RepID=UPI003B94389F
MESYSKRDNVLQYRAQLGFQEIMKSACAELGLDRDSWKIQHGGDGELAILPPHTSERVVVARLTPTLDRLLREYNRGLSDEARIRLRLAVHEGPVHLSGVGGFPSDAVVFVCRLVDSPQLRQVLRRHPGAQIALMVSDRIYQDIVQNYRDPRPDQFLRVIARLPEKGFEAVAWIYVPGENAAAALSSADGSGIGDQGPRGRAGESAEARHSTSHSYPPAGGQVFRDITSHGTNVFGNGNSISAPAALPSDSWRPHS